MNRIKKHWLGWLLAGALVLCSVPSIVRACLPPINGMNVMDISNFVDELPGGG